MKKKNVWKDLENEKPNVKEEKNKELKKTNKKDKNIKEKIVVKEKIIYKQPKFKVNNKVKKTPVFIVSAIIISLVFFLTPFFILMGLAATLDNNKNDVIDDLGYRVNQTVFAIEHDKTGMYIKPPSYKDEVLSLDSKMSQTFKFSNKETSMDGDHVLEIQSDKYYGITNDSDHNYLEVELNKGNPTWGLNSKDKGISLERKKGYKDSYGIRLNNNGMYLAKDENNDNLKLSWTPDWFHFIAITTPIKTTQEYIDDYNFLHYKDKELDQMDLIGESGNPLSIKLKDDNEWITSINGLGITKNEEFNFFIPKTKNGDIEIASYETLKYFFGKQEDIDKYKFYNVLSNSDNELSLDQIANTHTLPDEEIDVEAPDVARIWLCPDPTNLWRKSILFYGGKSSKDGLKYVSVNNGNVELSKDPEYFYFNHSNMKNPEFFSMKLLLNSPGSALFNLSSENIKSIYKFKIEAYGVDFFAEDFDIDNPKIEATINKEVSLRHSTKNIWFKDLDKDLSFFGTITLYRRGSVGKHTTTKLLTPFGKPISDKEPKNIKMWNSTVDYINIEDSWNKAEVSIDFKNEPSIKVVNDLDLRIDEVNDEGKVTEENVSDVKSISHPLTGIVNFEIDDLKEETRYKVTTLYNKDEKYEEDKIQEDLGVYQIYLTTERKMPDLLDPLNPPEIKYNHLGTMTITIELKNWKNDDKILQTWNAKSKSDDEWEFYDEGEDWEEINNGQWHGAESVDVNSRFYNLKLYIKVSGFEGWEDSDYWDKDRGPNTKCIYDEEIDIYALDKLMQWNNF